MLLVSDIHFGRNRLQDVERFIEDAKNPEMNPDRLVVIAGDMTQFARKNEFDEAEQFVDRLLKAGLKIVLTPGNHDFGDWIGEYIRTNRKARSRTKTLLKPIFEQKEIIAAEDFDSILKIDNDVFVVLRSTHRGKWSNLGLYGANRITRKQIHWAFTQLTSLDTDNCRLHLVTHRSLWKESGDQHSRMVNPRLLEGSLLRHFSFRSFIHGHNHRFLFAQTSTPKLGLPITRLALPTLSTRNRHWQRGYVRWDAPYDKPPVLIGIQ